MRQSSGTADDDAADGVSDVSSCAAELGSYCYQIYKHITNNVMQFS